MGTRGSRGGVVSAGAALGAARVVKQKLLRIAAHLLEAPLGDLELVEGSVRVRGAPASRMTVAQLAQKAYVAPMEPPPGWSRGSGDARVRSAAADILERHPHLRVEIDPGTGADDPRHDRRGLRADARPARRRGRLHGATAQGLGGALLEEVVYDADGQNRTATLLDYALPIAELMPSFETEHLERLDPNTPLGMKGMAEGGVMGASAAISNAVADALAPLGAAADRQPFTARRIADGLRTAR